MGVVHPRWVRGQDAVPTLLHYISHMGCLYTRQLMHAMSCQIRVPAAVLSW